MNERLLRLNPGDNHGIRYRLAVDYLQRDDTAACLRLAGQFADDPALPAASSGPAAEAQCRRREPDGDDRAWVYRDAMRALWQRSPGALEWAAKVLGPGAIRG